MKIQSFPRFLSVFVYHIYIYSVKVATLTAVLKCLGVGAGVSNTDLADAVKWLMYKFHQCLRARNTITRSITENPSTSRQRTKVFVRFGS